MFSACKTVADPGSGLAEVSHTQLTPTMHTAFQLTPASERMPEPIPVEGFGMYEIEGLGGNEKKSDTEAAEEGTAVSQAVEESDTGLLAGGSGGSGSNLVEGNLAAEADALVRSQVVVVTPRPKPVSQSRPGSTVNTYANPNGVQPLPTGTPLASGAQSGSLPMPIGTAVITATPTPICGGNIYNKVGPAHRVEKMPIEFDEFGTWMRSENTYGAFLQTNVLRKSGTTAAWMCYFFNTPEDETAVFTQIRPISGQPNTVRMWVYGNHSGHFLGVWILDREYETWLVPLGPIEHDGWELLEATFAGPNAGSIFYISGSSNDRIDYPISFRGVSLNDFPDDSITYGGIVIDDISFVTK